MTQNDVQRGIKNARDILVGKVPDPKSQVDQITLALMYKFIDDMDQSAEEMNGKATFFTGEYKKYAWHSLMDVKIGNQERMNLYDEALKKLPFNENLPQLFREIFKDAFLPYRDPNTLSLFLKEINNFSYDNSENLGSAFEHLLSVMSSQGDAGQFRTPRHIINFIVEAVNPGKTDTVLDPACGTAGFLISAYKHILKTNENKLNPDERKRISDSFAGYDISPDMVRLSLVNLYLHGFKQPKIVEYDTLGSDSKWNEFYDVILANPPFMSPRGGIKPHKRFEVQANRSEVLFVDYIMEHLTPNGRGGVIVPEGIIFQSANAYKALRKMLVDNNFLYAVVSLPAGVFNPYSGVKTSILLMDRVLAKKAKGILFVKIQNDGLDLGAQRRPIEKNDLPKALQIIKEYQENSDKEIISDLAHVVSKTKIAESGDYNLSGDRYRVATDYSNAKWPIVELGKICEIEKGSSITKAKITHGNVPVIAGGQQPAYYHNKSNRTGQTITVSASGAYAGFVNFFDQPIFASDCTTIKSKEENKIITRFVYYFLKINQEKIYKFQKGMGQPHVYGKELVKINIPLPPQEVQKQIINEIEKYQKIIDGAKQVIANWKPKIDIDPAWKIKAVSEIAKLEYGIGETAKDSGEYRYVRITDIGENGELKNTDKKYIKETKQSKKYLLKKGDVLVARTGATFGKTMYFDDNEKSAFAGFLIKFNFEKDKIFSKYFWCFAQSDNYWEQAKSLMTGGGQPQFNANAVGKIILPLPTLEIQKQIVGKIEEERKLIEANKKLIKIMEAKIKKIIENI